jgi:hypothetical protein
MEYKIWRHKCCGLQTFIMFIMQEYQITRSKPDNQIIQDNTLSSLMSSGRAMHHSPCLPSVIFSSAWHVALEWSPPHPEQHFAKLRHVVCQALPQSEHRAAKSQPLCNARNEQRQIKRQRCRAWSPSCCSSHSPSRGAP